MPRWLKSLLLALAIVWVAVVYAPYLRGIGPGTGGFLAGDLAVLAEAAGGAEISRTHAEPVPLQDMGARAYLAAGGERGSLLTGVSLALSRRLWGVSESSATLYRLENLLLLLALGLGLANFTRRLLLPWTGADHARAAARALPAALFLHPFTVYAVTDLLGRGDLLYLALGSWAAATYLRARQDRKPGRLVPALFLFVAAHLAGRFGLGLATALAVAEFASVQRYQLKARRTRRALTTFALFGCFATVELLVRSGLGGRAEAAMPFHPGAGSFLERFGVLLLPVPTPGLPMALAVVLLFGAMHPALRAARWAPRLWGWLLGVWFGALCLALYFGGPRPGGSIGLGDFTRAGTLFPAAVILTTGMVVVATGVQGFRRLVLPIGLALGLGLLSLSQAPDHVRAARATSALRADLERAMDKAEELGSAGAGPQILVVRDTPADEVLHPFAGGIGHLLDASLTGRVPTGPLPRPMLVTTDAFTTFAREPEFDETRASGTLLVVEHELVVLPAPALFEAPPLWRGAASSPDLDLDPFTVGALVVVVPAERLAAGEPLPRGIDFSARATGAPARTIGGLWLASRGRTEGLFDFSDDLDWLLAGRIGRIWFEGGLARVDACELLPSLPGARGGAAEALAPEVVDSAWRFAIPPSAAELEVLGDPPVADGYRLTQLDLTSLRLRVFEASTGQPGILHFAGAERGLETWSQGEVAWTLERRVDGRTIWRHRGRRP